MKKKILLVDDDLPFALNVKDFIEEKYGETFENIKLEVEIFGYGGIGVIEDHDVGKSFLSYLKKMKDEYITDVIFCDFQLNNGKNALNILEYTKEVESLPPIVVMTANDSTMYKKETIQAIELGARGYIIKTRDSEEISLTFDFFLKELHVSTLRVYEEHKQRITNRIITKINKIEILEKKQKETDINIGKIEKLAKHFVKTFTEYYPYYTLFVRKYEKDTLKLLSTNIKESKEHLISLDVNSNKMLKKVINDGIEENIDMQEFLNSDGNIDDDVKKAIEEEKLHKGIIKRVGEQGIPLGTISIYCHKKDKEFDKETIDNFSNIIDSVKRDWELIGHNERTTNELEFIKNILYCEDENEVWYKLCKLLHEQFNEDSAMTKTTIKVYKSLSGNLERVVCKGAYCDLETEIISTDAPNISSWVYRNIHFVVLDIDAFKNPNSDKKELKKEFIDKLAKNGRDRKIKYVVSNKDMKSELCMPIVLKDKVLGILNLESSHDKAYTQGDCDLRKEIDLLLKVACKRVENIRLNKFVEMLYAVGKGEYEERFKTIENYLKGFIGFSHFSIIAIDGDKFKIEHISDKNDTQKEELEKAINSGSAIKSFVENEEKSDFRYISKSSEDKSFNNLLKSKSQYIFKMRHDNNVIGVINIEFDREDPIEENIVKRLKTLIQFLAKDIKENEDFIKLKLESGVLSRTMSQISHSLTRYINLDAFVNRFLNRAKTNNYDIEEYEEFLETLKDYSYGLMLHVGISRVSKYANKGGTEKENMFDYLKEEKFIKKIRTFIKKASEINNVLCRKCNGNSLILDDLNGDFTLCFDKRDSSRLSQNYMKYIIFELIFNAMKAMENIYKPYIKFYTIDGGICVENRVNENFNKNTLENSSGSGLKNVRKIIEEQGGKIIFDDKERGILKIKLVKKESKNDN